MALVTKKETIEKLRKEKEAALAVGDFDKAAKLRDEERKLADGKKEIYGGSARKGDIWIFACLTLISISYVGYELYQLWGNNKIWFDAGIRGEYINIPDLTPKIIYTLALLSGVSLFIYCLVSVLRKISQGIIKLNASPVNSRKKLSILFWFSYILVIVFALIFMDLAFETYSYVYLGGFFIMVIIGLIFKYNSMLNK